MKNIYLSLIILSSLTAFSQELQITNVKLVGDQVEVHYDILDEQIDRTYSVYLYTSKDNYIQSMESVTGDVGVDIPVGHNKIMYWNAREELGDTYDGSVAIELKGNFYVPFITIEGLNKGQVLKRGKAQDFIWSGGRGDNILNFELYKGDEFVLQLDERPNTGNTVITIPKKVKKGNDYRFKISDSKNRDEVVFTPEFTIKPKMPLYLKLGVAFVAGATAYYLYTELKPVKEEIISEPPLPEN